MCCIFYVCVDACDGKKVQIKSQQKWTKTNQHAENKQPNWPTTI
jgi:hypothetical protein